jgi:hypothetical protein
MRDRQLLTIDVEEAASLADAEAQHLLRSAGVFDDRFGAVDA